MNQSAPVDGFRLAYDREGHGPAVVLLHGWPGDRTDYHAVLPLLSGGADVVAPDLRGFGESDKHPADQYSAAAQARSVVGLIEELGLVRPVLAGYDIGSRIAQTVAGTRPDLVSALVVAPPLPGVGQRVLGAGPQEQFWYQPFHQLALAEELIDGRPEAVRAYLRHFWNHWSGPDYQVTAAHLDHLVARYGEPGAFVASINWYRSGAGTVARSIAERTPEPADRVPVPITVLWPEYDPLFPVAWSDRIDEFYADAQLRYLDGVGHFVPLEAPREFAAAITAGTPPAGL
jgi:pimeloyl-ACP methyl ester carboxylesterase